MDPHDPSTAGATGTGLATLTADGRVLDTWFLQPELADAGGASGTERLDADAAVAALGAAAAEAVGPGPDPRRRGGGRAHHDRQPRRRRSPTPTTPTCASTSCPTGSSVPNSISLEGLFGHLPNVVWTQLGPVAVDELDAARLRARGAGTPLLVHSLDKFPRMVDYVIPRACASPTPTGSASAPTSARAPP